MKKPRSPGQRQFGSDRNWEKVAASPHVQRALKDPQIANALYQNFRQTGGQTPQQPIGMADGGGIPTAADINRLQQIRGGDIDPYSANQMEELAEESRPARFADGGANMVDLAKREQKALNNLAAAQKKNDQAGIQSAMADLQDINSERASASISAATSAPASGGIGPISGSTMQGLKQITGPMTPANELASIGGGALLGAGSGSPWGAIIGAGTAGLLNYFIRKKAAKKKEQEGGGWGGGGDGGGGGGGGQGEVTGSYNPSGSSGYNPSGSSSSQAGAPAPQNAAGPTLPPGPGLWMGTANTGFGDPNVTSSDGKTWVDSRGKPVDASRVVNQTQVKDFGQPAATAPASTSQAWFGGATDPNKVEWKMDPSKVTQVTPYGASEAENALGSFATGPRGEFMGTAPGASLTAGQIEKGAIDAETLAEDSDELAKGGPVPSHGIGAIPVLHTTIVIAAKPKGKPEKKSMGGDIPQSERRPRRPNAIPPVGGPHPFGVQSGARLPHGRVQVPRGSGSAIRGKRFGGIF